MSQRTTFWIAKKKVTMYLITSILLTICMLSTILFNSSWLYLIILLGIGFCVFIPPISIRLADLAVQDQKSYYRIIVGSRLIIYSIDCGTIILVIMHSL